MLAGPPLRDVVLPAPLGEVVGNRPVRPVWQNALGGLTFAVGSGTDLSYLKWAPAGSGLELDREVVRLAWAAPMVAVPAVMAHGECDEGSWMLTTPLEGECAVSPRWKARPAEAVAAIGEGLRMLHDALPVESCPFSWSAESRVADARRRVGTGELNAGVWVANRLGLKFQEAVDAAGAVPPVDRLVVCHGDACAPNTIIAADGSVSGHVDLGTLGVADRWADLAVATWSTQWNYGPGWEEPLLAAYGVAPDPDRTAYYRVLWELGP